LFVSVHGAVTACIGGCAPILWGLLLKSVGTDGAPTVDVGLFQWFFATVVAVACVLSVLIARLNEDTKTHVDPIIIGNAVLNPFRAASYLVNLIDAKSIVRDVVPSRQDHK
jgi:hypothetical protein